MRRLILLLAACAVAPQALARQDAADLSAPATPTGDAVDRYGTVNIPDPYRWLEADVRSSSDVRAWVEKQNRHARSVLDGIPERDRIFRHVDGLANIEQVGAPFVAGKLQFFTRRGVGEEQTSYWVREGATGTARKLIDPAAWSPDGSAAMAAVVPHRSGRYVAYAVQEAGADWRTWHVIDVETGRVLDDRIRWNKFSDISWDLEGKGFYYTRFPEPPPGEEYRAGNTGARLYYHRLGTPQKSDALIYENRVQPDHMFAGALSHDGRFIVVSSGYTGGGPDVRVRRAKGGSFVGIFPGEKSSTTGFRYVATRNGELLFVSNQDAPNGRLIAVDMRAPDKAPRVVIAESKSPLIGVDFAAGRIFARYLDDAKSRVIVYDLAGAQQGEVPLPGMGTASGFSGGDKDQFVYFSYSDFVTPASVYRYDTVARRTELVNRPKAPLVSEDYRTEQVFFTARDGKRIAMYLASRKSTRWTPDTPVLLYGYGGFNLSFSPDYRPEQVAWMDMGGIFAFPTLPGGGEYGDAWHRAGMLENKPAVFDAFTDAAEYLIAQKFTRSERLAAFGYSNGGLLVGAAMTRRPDLFAVALPTVGVLDMLRFPQFTNGRLWAVEYGSPADPRMFPILRGYSPYHNVIDGTRYPATLVTTGDTDDRVYPAHSFKFAARLQAVQAPDRPALLSVATKAGHGAGTPRSQVSAGAADRLAFTLNIMGLTPPALSTDEPGGR